MMESDSDERVQELEEEITTVRSTKKRKKFGRMSEVCKKLNLQSHTLGEYCRCSRLKCFENVPESCRLKIIKEFNLMSSADEQNAYLCGLIIVQEIQNRRPRKDEEDASLRDASYAYRVRFLDEENVLKEINVCRTAFLSIHGIKKKKVEGLQKKSEKYRKGSQRSERETVFGTQKITSAN